MHYRNTYAQRLAIRRIARERMHSAMLGACAFGILICVLATAYYAISPYFDFFSKTLLR